MKDKLVSTVIYAVYFAIAGLLVTGLFALQAGATP